MSNGPHWSLNDERNLAIVDFPSNPPVRLEYDAHAIDDLIAGLASIREAMEPPVPMEEPDIGTRIKVATVGRFFVQRKEPGLMLALLHPGLRWVGMMFGRAEAEHLIDTIRQRLPPDQSQAK